MKMTTRIISFLLAMLLLFGIVGCGKKPVEQETTEATTEAIETTERELTEEEKILAQRRDTVEQYMRNAMTILWRSTEDITWYEGGTTFRVEAGKLYRGIPYSYAYSTTEAFLDYAVGEPDEKGIYTVSGIQSEKVDTTDKLRRIGMDCSSAVLQAWTLVSDTCTAGRTAQMFQKYGVIPVGDYILDIEGDSMDITGEVVVENGRETIYEAYAQAQKGDAIVRVTGGRNHTRMVVDVYVEYKEDGTIDPASSYITFLESTSTVFGTTFESEELGETVYDFCGIDKKYTFSDLIRENYIPVTCQELVDASVEAAAEPLVTDSETQLSKDNILSGTLTTNKHMHAITLTITDEAGQTVQQAKLYHPNRSERRTFDMQLFVTETTPNKWGAIDLDALASGNYHCTVTIRMANTQEITARDFDFTV